MQDGDENLTVTAGTNSTNGAVITGVYGTLTLGADGTYSYILNDANAAVQGLDDLETLTDVFTYTASDGTASATATLTVTIFGTNDAPVANADTNWAQEDAADASGNVLITLAHAGAPVGTFSDIADTDIDLETLTVTNVQDGDQNLTVTAGTNSTNGAVITGVYGTLTLGANGTYSYILNDANAAVQGLDDLETLTDVFTYTASDGTASATATLTVTIFGTNDAPVANADTNWAKEDAADASGNVLITLAHAGAPAGTFSDIADTDIDVETLTVTNVQDGDENLAVTAGTNSTNGAVITGVYGTLTLGANGTYSYILNDANAAVQGLDDLETLTDVFTYTASDGTASATATLTVTIFGTNDAPVANADTNWAQEDAADASGNVLITLAHAGAPVGTFSDIADTDIDLETLTVTNVQDGDQNLTVTAGTNSTNGAVITGVYGTLTLGANGTYSYVVNNANAAVQGLDDLETLTDVFTYTASDGTASATATLTVTIFGTNDAPVANADTNWAKEDAADASGNVLVTLAHAGAPVGTFSDIADTDIDVETLTVTNVQDGDENLTVTAGTNSTNGAVITGVYGTLTLGADGTYSYILNDANAAVQGLDDLATLTDVFTYTASDGTASATATLTVTIFGTNDAPVANADTNWAQEDAADASGNVLITLAHAGAPVGTFSDIADTDIDLETLTVTNVQDGDQNLTVTAGTNSTNGAVITGVYGTLTLGANGTYSYILNDANAAVQGLDDLETLTDVFTYTASDGTASATATLTVTIFGTNDAPVANADTNWAKEDAADASGNVLITLAHAGAPAGTFSDIADTDIDVETLTVTNVQDGDENLAVTAGTNSTNGAVITGVYGTLTLGANGTYSYILNDANAAVQGLDDLETLTDVFTYTASDGTASATATLTVTIFGTNDAPVANADTNWAQEDAADASGNVLITLAHAGAPVGTFSDIADTDIDLETLTVTNVQDGDQNLAVTAGTNSTNGAVITGVYGTLTLGANGTYSYVVNNANAAVQGLDDLETLTDVFTYTASDGTATATATLTVTIFGTNDAPVANADTNWAQEDAADASGNVLITLAHAGAPVGTFSDIADTDIDLETLTVTNVQDGDENLAVTAGTNSTNGAVITGVYGTLTLGADGTYSYILNDANAAVQGLDDLETLTDVFTYTASDGTASATATLTVTIFGTNDAPVANADTNWAQEDAADASGNVLITLAHAGAPVGTFSDIADTDIDVETLTVTNVQDGDENLTVTAGTNSTNGAVITGVYGTLTLGANGTYSYILNDANAAVQGLDDLRDADRRVHLYRLGRDGERDGDPDGDDLRHQRRAGCERRHQLGEGRRRGRLRQRAGDAGACRSTGRHVLRRCRHRHRPRDPHRHQRAGRRPEPGGHGRHQLDQRGGDHRRLRHADAGRERDLQLHPQRRQRGGAGSGRSGDADRRVHLYRLGRDRERDGDPDGDDLRHQRRTGGERGHELGAGRRRGRIGQRAHHAGACRGSGRHVLRHCRHRHRPRDPHRHQRAGRRPEPDGHGRHQLDQRRGDHRRLRHADAGRERDVQLCGQRRQRRGAGSGRPGDADRRVHLYRLGRDRHRDGDADGDDLRHQRRTGGERRHQLGEGRRRGRIRQRAGDAGACRSTGRHVLRHCRHRHRRRDAYRHQRAGRR